MFSRTIPRMVALLRFRRGRALCGTQTSSLLLRISAGASPEVGSKTVSSVSIPFRDLSTGSGIPVALLLVAGETAEKADAVLTIEAMTRAVESFMVE